MICQRGFSFSTLSQFVLWQLFLSSIVAQQQLTQHELVESYDQHEDKSTRGTTGGRSVRGHATRSMTKCLDTFCIYNKQKMTIYKDTGKSIHKKNGKERQGQVSASMN
jgi:hypothetical protein